MKLDSESLRLYLITDRRWLKEGERLEDAVEPALKNGVSFLQVREKEASYEEFKDLAKRMKNLAGKYQIPLVINDNIEIAKEIDADGIHMGQTDGDPKEARKFLGKDKIIGVSASNLAEAIKAQEDGADYLGVGAVFPTSSKEVDSCISLEELKKISQTVKIPIVAIGGINLDNIDLLKEANIQGASLISAILASHDIPRSTRLLAEKAAEIF